MLKRITALALSAALTVLCLPAGAEENTEDETSVTAEEMQVKNEENIVLSLDEAIAAALEGNPQLEAADASIKSAELGLEVAKIKKKDFDDLNKIHTVPVNVSTSMETAYLKHGYYTYAAETGIELAKTEKDKIAASIAYDVTEKYFNLKLLERLLGIAETSYSIAEENAQIVKKQFELGYVSNLEVQNAAASVEAAQFAIEGYKRNIEIASESFKIAVQMDGDKRPLVLTDDLVLPQKPQSLEEDIGKAMTTRYDVTALRKAMEMQQEYFNITSDYVSDSTAAYHSAYSDFVKAKYNYENSSKMIALSIRNEYMSILTAEENIKKAESALKVKQIEYDSAKIKYDMGVMTNLQLTSVMTELDSCKVQLENANLSYMLAVQKYGYDITIGL